MLTWNCEGVVSQNDPYEQTTSTKATDLCIRYCSQLGLPAKITMISQDLAETMSTTGDLAGRSPLSVAASVIYFISHLLRTPKSAKAISEVAGVSEGTIRTSYKKVYDQKDTVIKPEWVKDGKGDIKLLPKV